MEREFPIWVIVVLPWLAALANLLLARVGLRVLERRAAMFGHYLGLGAVALALLFSIQGTQHLLVSEDPRALGHTPLPEWIGPIVIGELRIESTLIADRLSISAALLILGLSLLAHMFVPGPSGQRALFGGAVEEVELTAIRSGLSHLALLGLLEGAALLVVLAGDLALAALGWALLGFGAVVLVARRAEDERRTGAAMRMLTRAVLSDLAWVGAGVALVIGGIGLAHNGLWAPLTGDALYVQLLPGLSFADLIAAALLCAALLRMSIAARLGDSLGEAVLDAVLIPAPAIYVLLRYTRVLAYAPSVLATCLVLGMVMALLAAASALLRPRVATPWQARSALDYGLGATQLTWMGLVMLAIGVGAWRTVALLLLAHALGRLGLRLSLLVADGDRLPLWSSRVARVLCFGVAGIVPGLGFVALAQVLIDVFTRNSLFAPWISWLAAAVVLAVAFLHAAAIARLWYEELGRKPGRDDDDEDGLDLAPSLLIMLALLGLGLVAFAAWFGFAQAPLTWLDKVLPLAGGHESVPTGIQERVRVSGSVARPWVAGGAASCALLTGFAWSWARERFRRAHGGELAELRGAFEFGLSRGVKVLEWTALLLEGLSQLAARGIGRGGFEQGPQVLANLRRDWMASLNPKLRVIAPGPVRMGMLGLLLGFGLLLGWLYAKPEVASGLPTDDYGFGGLRPRLIRAGGGEAGAAAPTVDAPTADAPTAESTAGSTAGALPSSPIAPAPLPPRRDGAEPSAPVMLPPEVQR